MDFGHLLEGLIFLIIGGVVFFALFPSLLSSGLTATSNATYTKTFPNLSPIPNILYLLYFFCIFSYFLQYAILSPHYIQKYNRYRMLGMGDRLGKILENTMYKHLLNCKVCNDKGNENEVYK